MSAFRHFALSSKGEKIPKHIKKLRTVLEMFWSLRAGEVTDGPQRPVCDTVLPARWKSSQDGWEKPSKIVLKERGQPA